MEKGYFISCVQSSQKIQEEGTTQSEVLQAIEKGTLLDYLS